MKIGVISLGCAKNQVDSEQMRYMLRMAGHTLTQDEAEAEVLIVNTCGFIDPAKEESIEAILQAAECKKGKCQKLLVTGCLAQRYGKELLEQIPEIDGLMGVEQYGAFPRILEETLAGKRPLATDRNPVDFACGRDLLTPPFSAYVRIAEGCDHRCGYCAIPLIRGRYRSRSMRSVLEEMTSLAASGAREQILIAQDTSGWGRDLKDGSSLAALIRAADGIPGLDWIRVLYLYAADVDRALVDALGRAEKFCRYLDVPLQHAVPRLLKAMHRSGDIGRMEDALLYAREKGFALRTTLIVGYPGETDADFDSLLSFVSRMRFDRLGAFAFSPEEGTPAAGMPGQVPEEIRRQRLDRLLSLQQGISLERNQCRVGREETVLVCEDRGGVMACRSAWEAPDADGWILAEGKAEPSSLRRVKITGADEYDLWGSWCDE